MVGHDNRSVHVISDTVVVETAGEDDVPRLIRKGPAIARAESNEVALVVALQMGEDATVEHFLESFTGCGPWTAGGGRPYVGRW